MEIWQKDFQNTVQAHVNKHLSDGIGRLGGMDAANARILAVLKSHDHDFVLDVMARFERVRLGFGYFALLDEAARPDEALHFAGMQPRMGWARKGVPFDDVQTIDTHMATGEKLIRLLFADDAQLDMMCCAFRYHDIGESVIGDFTPVCKIERADKLRVEKIAIDLLCAAKKQGHPLACEMANSFDIFEGYAPHAGDACTKVHEIDRLEMTLEGVSIRSAYPHMDGALKEFDAYVAAGLSHKRTIAFFNGLVDERVRGAEPRVVCMHAFECVKRADPAYAAYLARLQRGPSAFKFRISK